jgi:hypothetical protein
MFGAKELNNHSKTLWTNKAKTVKSPLIDMKNDPLTTVLLGLLTVLALASAIFCWLYISNTREWRTLQSQVAMVQNNRNLVNSLVTDAVEYSKKDPTINPILESVGVKSGKSAPTNAPKSPTK